MLRKVKKYVDLRQKKANTPSLPLSLMPQGFDLCFSPKTLIQTVNTRSQPGCQSSRNHYSDVDLTGHQQFHMATASVTQSCGSLCSNSSHISSHTSNIFTICRTSCCRFKLQPRMCLRSLEATVSL